MTGRAQAALLAVISALALGACSTQPALPPQVAMNLERVSVPPAYGVSDLIVTTQSTTGDPIAGALCEARSAYSAITVTTPARARFPDLDAASPPITVTCQAGGLRGETVSSPSWRNNASSYGYPSVGLSWDSWGGPGVGVGWYGGYDGYGPARRPAIRYPQATVILDTPY